MKTDSTLLLVLVASTFVSTLISLGAQYWSSRNLAQQRVRLEHSRSLQEKQADLIADLFANLWMANYALEQATRRTMPDDVRLRYRSEAARLFTEAARAFYPRQILFDEATASKIDVLLRGLEDAQLRLSFVLDEPAPENVRWDDALAEVRMNLPQIFADLKALSRRLLRVEP